MSIVWWLLLVFCSFLTNSFLVVNTSYTLLLLILLCLLIRYIIFSVHVILLIDIFILAEFWDNVHSYIKLEKSGYFLNHGLTITQDRHCQECVVQIWQNENIICSLIILWERMTKIMSETHFQGIFINKLRFVTGKRRSREACRRFGPAPGLPHSHTKPLVRSKGRKFERARGRRSSCGYKK